MSTVAPSLGKEQLGHEANHSPSSSAEDKEWNYTSTPPLCPQGTQSDNLTFALFIVDTVQIALFSHKHILISQKNKFKPIH
jgi:hypothetical protein